MSRWTKPLLIFITVFLLVYVVLLQNAEIPTFSVLPSLSRLNTFDILRLESLNSNNSDNEILLFDHPKAILSKMANFARQECHDFAQEYTDIRVNGEDVIFEEGYTIPPTKSKNHLNVYLVFHSHIDPGWLRTFDEYYVEKVETIINNAVNFLSDHEDARFIWSEMSYLELWYRKANSQMREKLLAILSNGQLELCGGAWVMTDEATPYFWATIDNIVEGQQFVREELNATVKNSWSVDPFGHGAMTPYLLSLSGVNNLVVGRLDKHVKEKLIEHRALLFSWAQPWNTGAESNLPLISSLPRTYYTTSDACGPDTSINFSTLSDYFDAVNANEQNFSVLRGDFFPYTENRDGSHPFWTGFYVHRPDFKRLERITQGKLRRLDILRALSDNSSKFESLQMHRRNLALAQHHDAITGTSKPHVMADYKKRHNLTIFNQQTTSELQRISILVSTKNLVVNYANGTEIEAELFPYMDLATWKQQENIFESFKRADNAEEYKLRQSYGYYKDAGGAKLQFVDPNKYVLYQFVEIPKMQLDTSIEVRVELISSPTPLDGHTLSMNLETTIENEDVFWTDINGLYLTKRQTSDSIATAGNFYPAASSALIEDHADRVTVLFGQPTAVTTPRRGNLEFFVDRNLHNSDGKGLDYGDPATNETTHLHYRILIEKRDIAHAHQTLYLSRHAHESLEELLHPSSVHESKNVRTFKPIEWPCDIQLINLRHLSTNSNSTLLTLRKLEFDCTIVGGSCSKTQSLFNTLTQLIPGKRMFFTSLTGSREETTAIDEYSLNKRLLPFQILTIEYV
ncbi:Alpha-mannosidase 2 [Aphelenchoides besseyi]|nr:Alpha-mannosidase 2 [Aphelenchoides besseyi]